MDTCAQLIQALLYLSLGGDVYKPTEQQTSDILNIHPSLVKMSIKVTSFYRVATHLKYDLYYMSTACMIYTSRYYIIKYENMKLLHCQRTH